MIRVKLDGLAMGERRYDVTIERVFAAPPRLVWALMADTDRWDRASGLTPGRYEWRKDPRGLPMRAATAVELGFEIEWIEPPYEWVEGHFVYGSRRFLKGPVATGGFTARCHAEGGKTRVVATPWVSGEGGVILGLGPFMQLKFRRALTLYMDSVQAALSQAPTDVDTALPAFEEARAVLSQHADPVTQGPRHAADGGELSRRLAALKKAPVSDAAVEHLAEHLARRPDEEVAQMRPFELARRWGLGRREVLRAFLHATTHGLTELRWQINCPVCRVAASVEGALEAVRPEIHCAACNVRYDVDFDRHVEAVFGAHPALREVDTRIFCASSPSFLPHVLAQLEVGAGDTRSEPCDPMHGKLLVRSLHDRRRAEIELDLPSSLHATVRDDGFSLAPVAVDGTGATLALASEASEAAVLVIERVGWNADAVLGSAITTLPEFHQLFATEAPASGVELTVSRVVLLFSDLTGSTALYERVGDARAFAVVQEHFGLMGECIERNQGAIVKTMGDAVMASFARVDQAVQAAIDMAAAARGQRESHGVDVKLGIHAGPCLMIRANDRHDYFGTTANVAARLQAQAGPAELVVTEALADEPGVPERLSPFERQPFSAELKGIEAQQKLLRFTLARAD